MKVGIALTGVVPADGGAYTFAVELLQALDRQRANSAHELVLCCHDGAGEFAGIVTDFGSIDLDAQRTSVLSFQERLMERLPDLMARVMRRTVLRSRRRPAWDERVLRREGIEFLVRLVPWQNLTLDIPYATTLWDIQHRLNPWFPEVSAGGEWDRREHATAELLRRASLIYVGTREGQEQISRFYQIPSGRVKVLVSPCPAFALNAGPAPANAAVTLNDAPAVDYLFYPAQFWPHKNHVVILEACRYLRLHGNWDLRVVFTGSDKGNEAFVKSYAAKLGLSEQVSFRGLVDRSALLDLYRRAFCLVYPTFCGPEGLPPMEAFALGCPVVASDIPGAREQLGAAALLFAPTDENALAACILKLRDAAVRKQQVAAGRALAKATSWDDYARGILESLDEFELLRRTWR